MALLEDQDALSFEELRTLVEFEQHPAYKLLLKALRLNILRKTDILIDEKDEHAANELRKKLKAIKSVLTDIQNLPAQCSMLLDKRKPKGTVRVPGMH